MKGEFPFQQNDRAFQKRSESVNAVCAEVFEQVRFPAEKPELIGRATGVELRTEDGKGLSLREVIEQAPKKRFESLAEIVDIVETALERGSAGTGAGEYPPTRPHAS